jgi:hypothetical protein
MRGSMGTAQAVGDVEGVKECTGGLFFGGGVRKHCRQARRPRQGPPLPGGWGQGFVAFLWGNAGLGGRRVTWAVGARKSRGSGGLGCGEQWLLEGR